MADVSFKRVSKVYPSGVAAVKDFSLDIADKEFLVIVGPSGCGKSTVLRLIAGLENPDSGEILIDGVRVDDKKASERGTAMVFQNYALFPHMTVRENMAFGLKNLPKPEADSRVNAAAEMLGLKDCLDRKPKSLSGGQRQRVALGRALVCSPKVFLLDEPLSNLDAKLRSATRAEIIQLHERLGSTFIYVTHDQTEAMTMGSRIAVINHGVLQQAGTPQSLYHSPANKFVASFIGTPEINFLDAFLTEETINSPIIRSKSSKVFVNICGEKAALSADLAKRIPREFLDGRSVTAGIRPDAVSIGGKKDRLCLAASVTLVEELGGESHIFVKVKNSGQVIVKTPSAHGITKNENITISLDLSALIFFDKQSEKNIMLD